MSPSDEPSVRDRCWVAAGLLAVLVLAAVLRFRAIGAQSLSVDEGLTAELAELPLPRLIPAMRKIEQLPPLYHLLMLGWVRVSGGTGNEAVFRTPSAIFSLAAVAAVFLLGRRLFGSGAGLAAALLMAVSNTHIVKAQDARPYSLFVLLALLVCERFAALVDESGRRAATAVTFSILTAMMLYTHLYGATIVAAQACVLGVLAISMRCGDEHWRRWLSIARAWLLATVGAGVLISPWGWRLWKGHGSDIGFRPGWIPDVTAHQLGQFAQEYAGSWTLVGVLGCFIVIGAITTLRKRPIGSWLCLAVIVCGIALPVVVSVTVRPVFISRYGLPAQAMLLLLAGAGIAAVARCIGGARSALVGSAILLVIVTLSLCSRIAHPRPDWRGLVAGLRPRAQPNDIIVLPRWFDGFVFRHYIKTAASSGSDTLAGLPAVAYDDPDRPDLDLRVRGQHVWWIVDLRVGPGERPGDFKPSEHEVASARTLQGLELRELLPTDRSR